MPERRPPEITESIAEALRAGLVMVAVVLLARANVGALTRSPSVWIGLPVGLLVWVAAAWAARWSSCKDGSRLRVWRDCVAPALITLLIAGRGGAGSLPMAIGLLVLGALAVSFVAGCCRLTPEVCERPAVELETVPTVETIVEEANRENSPRGGSEPMFEREGEAPAEPRRGEDIACGSRLSGSFALPVGAESGHADRASEGGPPFDECIRPNTRASDAEAATQHQDPLPAVLNEVVETTDDGSTPVESWTRTESDGEVSIEAVVLARFIEGSKLAVVHLPFVPPLPAVPQIECEPLDSGCDVTIQTDAAYRHGARLSITRPSAGPAEFVPIGVMIYTSAEEQIEL